jgi:hypothetical protein
VPNSSKHAYRVVTAAGETVDVTGVTRAEQDPRNASVTFYDGDEPVASFRGFTSFHRV